MTTLGDMLDGVFPGHAGLGRTLRLPEPGAVPLPNLLRPAGLASVAARYAASFPGGERRAVLSFWSQHYLLVLVPAVVAAALAAQRDLPVALDGSAMRAESRGWRAPLRAGRPRLSS